MEGPKAHCHLLVCVAFLEEPTGLVLTHTRRGNDSEFHRWLLETLSCATQGTDTPLPRQDGAGDTGGSFSVSRGY